MSIDISCKFQEHWKQGRLEFTSDRPHYSLALFSCVICTCTASKKDKFAFKRTRLFSEEISEYANNGLVSRIAVRAETCRMQNLSLSYSGLFVAIGLSSIFRYVLRTNYHCPCSFLIKFHVSNVLSSCKFQVKHSLLRRRVWLTKLVKICSQTKRITSAYLPTHVTCSFRGFSERIKISWIRTATVKGNTNSLELHNFLFSFSNIVTFRSNF